MPDASGSVNFSLLGGTYASAAASWSSAGTQGVSLQMDNPGQGVLKASGVTTVSCPSTASYGASGQKGTPGAANGKCFPWTLSTVPGTFQSIATTGHPITGLISTGSNSIDAVNKGVDFTAAPNLGHAVNIGGTVYGSATKPLQVDSNGFISLSSSSSSNSNSSSIPSTVVPNGVLAIFWEDLAGNATTGGPSGVFWKQFDPDGVPASGDEYTLVSWENWKSWYATTSSLNFQIKILEATGSVEFQYGSMSANPVGYANGATNTTVWLESLDGKLALPISYNAATIQSNTGYRFTYSP
jgi:hypothetical protein